MSCTLCMAVQRHGGKGSACQCRKCGFNPWVKGFPIIRRREWHPLQLQLQPEKLHGQGGPEGPVHGVTKSQTPQSNGARTRLLYLCFISSLSKSDGVYVKGVLYSLHPCRASLCSLNPSFQNKD